MTLTLSPETEARLLAVAAQRRLPPEAALAAVLAEAETDFNEAVAAIQEGLADLDAGDRGMLLEEYRAQVHAEREARRQERVTEAAA
ncbi:MAG: hypothetical protein JO250_04310 [Armatimonadetes bacterium]|nr:hypothetical protein [Armatimonadota bacterium]